MVVYELKEKQYQDRLMMTTFVVEELEAQRRELEARRALLEERFKLRIATMQVLRISQIDASGLKVECNVFLSY